MEYEKLMRGDYLAIDEAQSLFSQILSGELNSSQLAAVLGSMSMRGVQSQELLGARAAVKASCLVGDLTLPAAIDVCGTGGDGKSTFNISTCAAFVLAGLGIKIVKNGNYSASSRCGSSNVLEALGVHFPSSEIELSRSINEKNAVFIHAPLLYPALRIVAQVRRELKVRTIFNLLGPLLNPVQTGVQMVGVPNREVLRLYSEVLGALKRRFAVLTSYGGYDEVSLTGPTQLVCQRGQFELTPDDFGVSTVSPMDLEVTADTPHYASIIEAILQGKGTAAQVAVVGANAGLALWITEDGLDLKECTARAIGCINSGAAAHALREACQK